MRPGNPVVVRVVGIGELFEPLERNGLQETEAAHGRRDARRDHGALREGAMAQIFDSVGGGE